MAVIDNESPWKIIPFGDDSRVRIVDGETNVVVVFEEKKGDDWKRAKSITIPADAVGDVCASLARSYDRIEKERFDRCKRS